MTMAPIVSRYSSRRLSPDSAVIASYFFSAVSMQDVIEAALRVEQPDGNAVLNGGAAVRRRADRLRGRAPSRGRTWRGWRRTG
jgi:hypothetical protein